LRTAFMIDIKDYQVPLSVWETELFMTQIEKRLKSEISEVQRSIEQQKYDTRSSLGNMKRLCGKNSQATESCKETYKLRSTQGVVTRSAR